MAAKKAPAKKTQPSRTASNGLIAHTSIAAAIGILGLTAAFILLWWQVIAQPVTVKEQVEQQRLLQEYVNFFNSRAAELRASVDAMATAPATAAALISIQPGERERLESVLADQHPHLARVALIEKGKAEVDLNAEVPISFAALDLIRRAETREFVGPEVGVNQGGRIYAAQPITADGSVRGVLLAVFDRSFLMDPLQFYTQLSGSLEVLQTIPGAPTTTILNLGGSTGDRAAIEQSLVIPHWKVTFAAKDSEVAQQNDTQGLFIPFALAALFILAGAFLAFSRFSRKVAADAESLSSYAIRLLRGRGAHPGRYNLMAMQQAAAALTPYGQAPPAGEPEEEETLEDDDSDDLLEGLDREEAEKEGAQAEEETDFLDVRAAKPDDNFGIEVNEEEGVGPADLGVDFDPEIFRAYDIRGITTSNLTPEVVYWIGRAFAAEATEQGQSQVVVGRDGRHSGERLQASLTRGLTEGGLHVTNIGQVPTPVLYYATHALNTGTGIMITGSHNPPEYNGLKMMIGGVTLAEAMIQGLYQRLLNDGLSEGEGSVEDIDMEDSYIDRVLEDVAVAQPLKVVVDCGNGIAGNIAPRLLREIGCEVIELYCDVDGDFPNHHPDPAEPKNLEDVQTVVQAEQADLGLAFDGDGDRLGVVTNSGQIIWPDKLIMLFAEDIVRRNPGADIIYDVKCSRHLNNIISDLGGRPIMWKTGHSHMKAKLKETGALLAGEFSGHICFGERWYGFDDALYSAVRLLEILGSESTSVDDVFARYPMTYTTPEIKIMTTEAEKFEVMEKLKAGADFGDGTLTSIDGIRVDYADGWGLIRPSNTSPVLTLRFEADRPEALERIQDEFQAQLAEIDANLTFR